MDGTVIPKGPEERVEENQIDSFAPLKNAVDGLVEVLIVHNAWTPAVKPEYLRVNSVVSGDALLKITLNDELIQGDGAIFDLSRRCAEAKSRNLIFETKILLADSSTILATNQKIREKRVM